MTDAERMKSKYQARKAAGLCVRCGAGLLPEWGMECPECKEAVRTRRRRYAASPQFKARKAAQLRARYRANAEAARAKQNEARMERKVRGQCLSCIAPACEDCVFCPHHREIHNEASRRTNRKQRARLAAAAASLIVACGQPATLREPHVQAAPFCFALVADRDSENHYAVSCLDSMGLCTFARERAIYFAGLAHFVTIGDCRYVEAMR